jgi:TraM recognition site of TraD and TraG
MAREYKRSTIEEIRQGERNKALIQTALATAGTMGLAATPLANLLPSPLLVSLGILPGIAYAKSAQTLFSHYLIDKERRSEEAYRGGKKVLGVPPQRDCIAKALKQAQSKGKKIIDKYLVGFEVETGNPLWVSDEDMCSHGCVFAKTGVGKTLWLESLIFQQMLRGRASGCTFIDAKRDSGTLAHIIFMALLTGRIEDLIVIDPLEPIHSYNFVLTHQRPDVKARKVLRAGLPPLSDQSTAKHYDRLAADSIFRLVRAVESLGRSWSIKDMAVALSAFNVAYPHLRNLLDESGQKQALVELGHLASSYRSPKGALDINKITENLRGIASELHSIAAGDAGSVFCTKHTDLNLTDAILRGKIIYFMLPRLEEAEGASRMVKVFREDLEVSIGEITSSRQHNLEDPHLVIIDEGSSTFGPTWANLFELARKGRFSLLFGAQSAGGLADQALGLSEAFYERVMANVNLKVMMRVGDNRTAQDLAEWMGTVRTTKKSIGSGLTVGRNSSLISGLDIQARRMRGQSKTVSISEDEEDLVSAEELKHEMSAEKGLAWFDLGTGEIVKGRSFWFSPELPETWEGREFLTKLERRENDDLGLATWVDRQVLSMEQEAQVKESTRDQTRDKTHSPFAKSSSSNEYPTANVTTVSAVPRSNSDGGATGSPKVFTPPVEDSGPFKLNPTKRGRGRNTITFAVPNQTNGTVPAAAGESPQSQGDDQPTAAAAETQEEAPVEQKPRRRLFS